MTQKISIAFYNLENFFDTYNDPLTDDDAFTPKGIMHWIKKRFNRKSKKIAYTIKHIGWEETTKPPAIIGLAEVENKRVLKNIIKQKHLKPYKYGFIHFESKDKRGIDVALLYRKDFVKILESTAHPVVLYNDEGKAYNTRDILYVKLKLSDEIWHVFVNHWPSRREGVKESDFKRYEAAEKLSEIIDYIYYEQPDSKFVIMGDFNTNPGDNHIMELVKRRRLLHPAMHLFQQHKGSLIHKGDWYLFDQIMFSRNFNSGNGFHLVAFKIFQPDFLKIWHGKNINQPYRTYKGRAYQGGYSDHFPVYALLKKSDNRICYRSF